MLWQQQWQAWSEFFSFSYLAIGPKHLSLFSDNDPLVIYILKWPANLPFVIANREVKQIPPYEQPEKVYPH